MQEDWFFLCEVFETGGNRLEAFKRLREYASSDPPRHIPVNAAQARVRMSLPASVGGVAALVRQALVKTPGWFVPDSIPPGAVLLCHQGGGEAPPGWAVR